ncbi:MAG: transglycosylase SLT domain-containing protein [Bacteroidota bacterium]
MKKIFTNTFLITSILLFSIGCSANEPASPPLSSPVVLSHFDSMLVKKIVATKEDTTKMYFVDNQKLKKERWDQLAQPAFWKKIICLSPDSCIVNIADTRESLAQVPYNDWKLISEAELTRNKSKIREQYNIEAERELYVTSGKRDFFEHRKTMLYLSKAVSYFKEYGVDPWYAQTILLIESPGKNKSVSYAGANGPFQLMKSVAIKYGLVVNATRDDRTDLKKAAYASSQLISKICIPLVKKMLDSRNIPYNETDTWFRLLVMHSYHAGAGNVSCALNKINPTTGGQELIVKLWKTEACGFKNESQNYSQLALAALLNFQDLIDADGDTVFTVYGIRYESKMQRNQLRNLSREDQLVNCLQKYESDLVDGIIDFNYFQAKSNYLKQQLAIVNNSGNKVAYPQNEAHYIHLATQLMHKRMNEEAVVILKANLEAFPSSVATSDSLAKAYKKLGKFELSQKYSNLNNQEN